MNSQINFLLVVNPISGDIDKGELVRAVRRFASDRNIKLHLIKTDGKTDARRIQQEYNNCKPERILVIGGDGTIKIVAEALEGEEIIIGILPAGSANGLSVDLELPDTLEESLKIAFDGKPMPIDMVCINDKKSLHLSDIGLNASLVRNYENSNIRGKIGYALQGFTTLTEDSEPFAVTIQADDAPAIEVEARMVVIANSQKYGTGVIINPMGKLDDGKFEIVILKTFDLILLGKIVTGNMPTDGDVEIISAESARIKTAKPVHFQIDGEYIGEETALNVHILKHQLHIAVRE